MSNQTKHISSQGEVMYPEILEKNKMSHYSTM